MKLEGILLDFVLDKEKKEKKKIYNRKKDKARKKEILCFTQKKKTIFF
jgi:hypothetical protein